MTRLGDKGIHVEPGTLYPLLRRLEKQGLLDSEWDTNEVRPRKYYVLSETGKDVFEQLCAEWNDRSAPDWMLVSSKNIMIYRRT